MCNGLEITLNDGKKICLPIVNVRWPFPFPFPFPDPGPGPDPDPFRRVIDDIAMISTINQAIAHVRNEGARGQLVQAAQTALKTIAHQLPAGVAIGDGLMKVAAGR